MKHELPYCTPLPTPPASWCRRSYPTAPHGRGGRAKATRPSHARTFVGCCIIEDGMLYHRGYTTLILRRGFVVHPSKRQKRSMARQGTQMPAAPPCPFHVCFIHFLLLLYLSCLCLSSPSPGVRSSSTSACWRTRSAPRRQDWRRCARTIKLRFETSRTSSR